jgi:hypothetical protein
VKRGRGELFCYQANAFCSVATDWYQALIVVVVATGVMWLGCIRR